MPSDRTAGMIHDTVLGECLDHRLNVPDIERHIEAVDEIDHVRSDAGIDGQTSINPTVGCHRGRDERSFVIIIGHDRVSISSCKSVIQSASQWLWPSRSRLAAGDKIGVISFFLHLR